MIKLANHSRISFVDSLLVVAQKDKNRVCVDFRGLNKAVLADNYPLPRIDDLLSHFGPTPEEQIAYSQDPNRDPQEPSPPLFAFSSDLVQAYHTIPVAEKDQHKLSPSLPQLKQSRLPKCLPL